MQRVAAGAERTHDAIGAETADDAALLARARAGDREAFGALVSRHHALITALVQQRGGPRAPVPDLVQESFARALANLGGFRGGASFSTWTARIALNLTADWRRTMARHARLAPVADVDQDSVASTQTPAPDAAAANREDGARARVALDALPTSIRLAVTLRYIEELEYEEVAVRLNVSVQRVRTWVSRGLARVRRELGLPGEE